MTKHWSHTRRAVLCVEGVVTSLAEAHRNTSALQSRVWFAWNIVKYYWQVCIALHTSVFVQSRTCINSSTLHLATKTALYCNFHLLFCSQIVQYYFPYIVIVCRYRPTRTVLILYFHFQYWFFSLKFHPIPIPNQYQTVRDDKYFDLILFCGWYRSNIWYQLSDHDTIQIIIALHEMGTIRFFVNDVHQCMISLFIKYIKFKRGVSTLWWHHKGVSLKT